MLPHLSPFFRTVHWDRDEDGEKIPKLLLWGGGQKRPCLPIRKEGRGEVEGKHPYFISVYCLPVQNDRYIVLVLRYCICDRSQFSRRLPWLPWLFPTFLLQSFVIDRFQPRLVFMAALFMPLIFWAAADPFPSAATKTFVRWISSHKIFSCQIKGELPKFQDAFAEILRLWVIRLRWTRRSFHYLFSASMVLKTQDRKACWNEQNFLEMHRVFFLYVLLKCVRDGAPEYRSGPHSERVFCLHTPPCPVGGVCASCFETGQSKRTTVLQ